MSEVEQACGVCAIHGWFKQPDQARSVRVSLGEGA